MRARRGMGGTPNAISFFFVKLRSFRSVRAIAGPGGGGNWTPPQVKTKVGEPPGKNIQIGRQYKMQMAYSRSHAEILSKLDYR